MTSLGSPNTAVDPYTTGKTELVLADEEETAEKVDIAPDSNAVEETPSEIVAVIEAGPAVSGVNTSHETAVVASLQAGGDGEEHDDPSIAQYKDHFTLLIPSSTIRYRDGHGSARILEAPDAQFVLEETYSSDTDRRTISIRRIHDTSEGVRFLRIMYAVVAAFFTGFLFVFCLQLLLFLFLDLAIEVGATSNQGANWGRAIGAHLCQSKSGGRRKLEHYSSLTPFSLALVLFYRCHSRLSMFRLWVGLRVGHCGSLYS